MLSTDSLVSATPCSGESTNALQEREKVQNLFKSAQDGDCSRLVRLAHTDFEGQEIDKIRDGRGRTCLHFAAQAGHTEACRLLIEELGADADSATEDGDTPLQLAAAAGKLAVCKLLVSHGAHVWRDNVSSPQPLHRAAAAGNVPVVRWLLDNGTPVDLPSPAGTPLLWASGSGQVATSKVLLEAGANPDVQGTDGVSAILMAAAAGSSAAVRALIKAGANVNVKATGAVTPLHTAAECGSLETVEALLEAGADANARDSGGHTPLSAAAHEGDRAIVELLLSATKPYCPDWTVEGVLEAARNGDDINGLQRDQPDQNDTLPAVSVPEASEPDEAAAARHKRLGDEAFVAKDYPKALSSYTQSLHHSTSSHLPWANRAAVHLQLGQPEDALRDAQIARSLSPAYAKAWYREGLAAGKLGQWEAAANAYFSGYQADPTNKVLAQAFQDAVAEGRKQHQQTQAEA
ncbi:hypothetical protein WJX73_006231 [Symbiochloris irregularis]|uniref:Uncharacterized protein n=1 Tax=Symbiochloris irregularis TaxID=706552 RepID=A0AAW1PVF9_9CHLO